MATKTTKSTKTTKRKGDHVVFAGDHGEAGAQCLHCGEKLLIRLPIDLGVWIAAGREFERRHRNCPPPTSTI